MFRMANFLRENNKYLELEQSGADFQEMEKLTLGSLRRAVQEGDARNGSLMAGQIAGLIKKEDSCAEIMAEIMNQAQKLLKK